jgi:alpha-glucosidase
MIKRLIVLVRKIDTVICILALVSFQATGSQPITTDPSQSTALENVHILPTQFEIPELKRARTVRLYLPPNYQNETNSYPVLYMHDGQNLFDEASSFVGEWQVDETLNLLAKQYNFKLIVVGIDHGGEYRTTELAPYDHDKYGKSDGQAYLNFIIDVVKPYIDSHYRTKADSSNTGIMGSSLGGLMSHYAVYSRPDVFSKAGIYSPSFWYSDHAFVLTKNTSLPKTVKLDFLVGTKEGENIVADMQRMLDLIRLQQHPVSHLRNEVVPGAEHNEHFWRSRFAQSVQWLFQ